MDTKLCRLLGVEFPLLAFSHCRDVVALDDIPTCRQVVAEFAEALDDMQRLSETGV